MHQTRPRRVFLLAGSQKATPLSPQKCISPKILYTLPPLYSSRFTVVLTQSTSPNAAGLPCHSLRTTREYIRHGETRRGTRIHAGYYRRYWLRLPARVLHIQLRQEDVQVGGDMDLFRWHAIQHSRLHSWQHRAFRRLRMWPFCFLSACLRFATLQLTQLNLAVPHDQKRKRQPAGAEHKKVPWIRFCGWLFTCPVLLILISNLTGEETYDTLRMIRLVGAFNAMVRVFSHLVFFANCKSPANVSHHRNNKTVKSTKPPP